MEEQIVLVDEYDNETGTAGKLEAHEKAWLHRAFSVFVFDDQNRLLLQKRSVGKYHSGGLWTNSCCGHPRPGETTNEAAKRRLFEEMGFTCELKKEFDFIYKAGFGNGLTEHEFDHVFYGWFNGLPSVNPEEVEDWKYVEWKALQEDIALNPDDYTVWFKICINKIDHLNLV